MLVYINDYVRTFRNLYTCLDRSWGL